MSGARTSFIDKQHYFVYSFDNFMNISLKRMTF